MFIDAGHNIRIYCDYQTRTLRVQTNSLPAEWLPHWHETRFENENDWYASPLSSRVVDEEIDLAIMYF